MRKLIYKEDHQLYYYECVIFETDANISVEDMERISYEPLGAGRHSVPFFKFKELMNKHGHTIIEIARLPKNTIPENNVLEIVVGATGNY